MVIPFTYQLFRLQTEVMSYMNWCIQLLSMTQTILSGKPPAFSGLTSDEINLNRITIYDKQELFGC